VFVTESNPQTSEQATTRILIMNGLITQKNIITE
jgi:hypothetical protein